VGVGVGVGAASTERVVWGESVSPTGLSVNTITPSPIAPFLVSLFPTTLTSACLPCAPIPPPPPPEANLLFGRGLRAGIDRKVQKQQAAAFENEALQRLRVAAGISETQEMRDMARARTERAAKYEGADMSVSRTWKGERGGWVWGCLWWSEWTSTADPLPPHTHTQTTHTPTPAVPLPHHHRPTPHLPPPSTSASPLPPPPTPPSGGQALE
jgi:hypothetical protein